MSTATVGTPANRRPVQPRIPQRGTPLTVGGVRPHSHPPRVPGPFIARAGSQGVRGCTAATAVPPPMRLTDRGIAAILIAAMLLLVSAAVVIGLTAIRVTGADYVSYGQSSVMER